jgi:hypothetical protein
MNYSFVIRILLFILLVGAWYGGFWLLAGVATVGYLFRYVGYEVILLGWCLDIQFMTGAIPWYVSIFALMFIIVEWLKLRLLAYTT